MTHTLNQRQVNQVNNLRIMTEENNILQRNNKPGETEEEIENLGNIELTNGNLIMEYLPNYNTNESRNKIKPKINIKKIFLMKMIRKLKKISKLLIKEMKKNMI